ncbi:MAG: DNA repair protein RadC [Bacteroidales bacterium]|jgi:DNA repair protein RadC|nr:DNA repair protein RadC [Bacteroidales bacterium]MBQ6184800.1 DNA repair protein RadC [Bacteroidales bacterium]
MKIKELCADERPREKMFSKGAGAMSNAELLAILIGSGTKNQNVLEVANRLLATVEGDLSRIAAMDPSEVMAMDGIGRVRYTSIAAALELGKRCCLEARGIEKVPVCSPRTAYRLMIPVMKGLKHEEFWLILLNRANYVLRKEMVSRGGISSTVVDSKLIVKRALDTHATGVILVHNHPSGNPRPGREDLVQTKDIKKALGTFDISLVDHIIVCDDSLFSFADEEVYSAEDLP